MKDFDDSVKFDFIFVDAGQKFYSEVLSLILEKGLLLDDGTLVFDNVSTHSHLDEFILEVKSKFNSEFVDMGGGMLVLFK